MRLAASIRDMETVAGAALDRYHAVDRPDMPPPRMATCVRGDIESEVGDVYECRRVGGSGSCDGSMGQWDRWVASEERQREERVSVSQEKEKAKERTRREGGKGALL